MNNELNKNFEISDDMLDEVVGGTGTDTVVTLKYRVGDVVIIRSAGINYCPSCAVLLESYEATITGIRGILEGVPVYLVSLKCCGYKKSVCENDILRRV